MTSVDDAGDLDRIEALATAAGLPVEEYLQAALTAHARRKQQRPAGSSSLYQRIRYAGGLRRVVDKLYPRVLADPSLLSYFKQLDDERLKGLRRYMLTLLSVVTGGPSKYQGRDLHEAHAHLLITGDAFDRGGMAPPGNPAGAGGPAGTTSRRSWPPSGPGVARS
jgi:hypothetical protein